LSSQTDAAATGALIAPFTALRPTPEHAQSVIAPPYDVINSAEARAMAADRPWSFLHVSKPEIDLPQGADATSPEAYAGAADAMRRMLAAGVLRRNAAPAFYIYRMAGEHHVQTGIAAAASVAAYVNNRIRRHELTRPDKEDDRVRQIEAVNAETGPVLTIHRPDKTVAAIAARITAGRPANAVTAPDRVAHSLWPVAGDADIAALTAAFEAMEAIYIGDGHHRSAAAARITAARRAANPAHRGDEPYNRFLIVSFAADEVRILDYNRLVRDLNGMATDEFLHRLEADFAIVPGAGPVRPDRAHDFAMYLAGRWYRLTLRRPPPIDADPVARLDISLLTERVLAPLLGIEDPRLDPRIDFVGGSRGLDALARRVDSGEMAVAFALWPTAIDDLLAVADAGLVMPPKSTWFEPKLVDGLIAYPLD
jgi:uncharacterized protein (DUF1015 family)